MTADELVSVFEDLLEGMAVADLRQGIELKPANQLTDQSWGILVRFLGGERPRAAQPAPQGQTVEKTWMFDEGGNPVDAGARPPVVRTLPKPARDPEKPLELKGSFEGVELP